MRLSKPTGEWTRNPHRRLPPSRTRSETRRLRRKWNQILDARHRVAQMEAEQARRDAAIAARQNALADWLGAMLP